VLGAPPARAGEEGLVETEGGDRPDPGGIVDQRRAVGDHRVHDGVPVTAELAGDLGDGAPLPADLGGGPPAGPICHPGAGRGDPPVRLGPRAARAHRFGTAPAALAPHQGRRPPERRQIDELDRWPVLDPRPGPAARTAGDLDSGLDMHSQRLAGLVLDADDGDVGQSDEQGAHARSVGLHRDSGGSKV
jgi:hypothetical protein